MARSEETDCWAAAKLAASGCQSLSAGAKVILLSLHAKVFILPDAVENDPVRLQANEFVLHSDVMKPGRFSVDNKCVWKPKLVHEATVQAQSFIRVIVRQPVISPALMQKDSHCILLEEKSEQQGD